MRDAPPERVTSRGAHARPFALTTLAGLAAFTPLATLLGAVAITSISSGCASRDEPVASPRRPTLPVEPSEETAACPADEAPLAALPGWPEPTAGHLRAEIVDSPERGACVTAQQLLGPTTRGGPVVGALAGAGEGRRFALHTVRDVVELGDGPFALVAAASGLWLHDAASLARRARLHPGPVVAVAASADGARAAALIAETAHHDLSLRSAPRASARHTLVAFEVASLRVLARVEGAPQGRLRLSPDGSRLLLAAPGDELLFLDLETGEQRRHATTSDLADADFAPDDLDVVAHVGHQNAVLYRNLATGELLGQRRDGAVLHRTRRDLKSVRHVPAAGLTVVGGDDNRVHLYRGMRSEQVDEVASFELAGNVEALACCRGARFVAGTDQGELTWFEGSTRAGRSLGPLVPGLLSDPIRVALWRDDVLAAFFGQLFRWTAGDLLVRIPSAPGQLLLQHASARDVLLAVRLGSRVTLHRVLGDARPSAVGAKVTELAWADALRIVHAPDGTRAVLGLDTRGVQVAFVDAGGQPTLLEGPGMSLSPSFHLAAGGARGRFVLWDARGRVYEVDLGERAWRHLGQVEEPPSGYEVRYDPRLRRYEGRDERGRRYPLVAVESE